MRLYPQRLGDILQQHLAFSTVMSISEKLQKVDQLKAWLDSFRPLSPTLVAELKKLYDICFTYHCFTELSQTYSSLTIQPGFIPEGL
ncbi:MULTISPECIES: hypothetical protein [unclassified Microcoleus]|uniref:hypothetical protein n=1 Tax=unclassified Microcoleus TaxID=2642155 RepID=UPI002FD44E09